MGVAKGGGGGIGMWLVVILDGDNMVSVQCGNIQGGTASSLSLPEHLTDSLGTL